MTNSRAMRNILFPLLIAVAGFVVFATSLRHDFVYDDHVDIREVDNVFVPGAWPALFYTASAQLYRPATYLGYALDNAVWGWKPFGWHLHSLLLHGVVSVLVYGFIRRLRVSRAGAAAGALWFAVHPIHAEAVVWVSSRAFLYSTAGVLLIGCGYLAWREHRRPKDLACIAAGALVAFLSKEDALMVVPVLAAMELFLFRRFDVRGLLGDTVWHRPLVILVAVAVPYLVARQSILAGLEPGEWANGLAGLAATLPVIIVRYLGQLVLPLSMTVDQPLDYAAGFGVGFRVCLPIVLTLLAVCLVRKPSLAPRQFEIAWFFLFLLPVMGFIPIAQPFADRFLYLPSVAAALFIGHMTDAVAARPSRVRQTAMVLFTAWMCLYVVLSVRYTRTWRNDETLWRYTVEVNPQSYRGFVNIGVLHNNQRDWDTAMSWIDRALAIKPDYVEAKVAKAYAFSGLGRGAEAEALYREALPYDPENTIWMNLLAFEVMEAGRLEEAEAIYDRILELRPGYVAARLSAGFLAARMKDFDKAVMHWETVLTYDPDNEAALGNLQVLGQLSAPKAPLP